MARALVLRTPGGRDTPIEVGARPVSIGRGRDCTIRIEDASLAALHLELRVTDGKLVLRKLGGATTINGGALEGDRELAPGDMIQFGASELLVPDETEDAAPALTGDPWRDRRNVELLLAAIAEVHAVSDPDELLRRILDRAIVLGQGSRGAILLESAGVLEAVAARSREGGDLAPGELLTRTVPARAFEHGRAIVLTDTRRPEQHAQASPSVFQGSIGSVLAVPLPSRRGLLGVLYVDSTRSADGFGPAELQFFEALAAQCAVAIERARLQRAESDDAARAQERLEAENAALREHLGGSKLLSESPSMARVLELARRVAPSGLSVLVTGETGTGKEVLARRIHDLSPRAARPFVVVDCGALPETLIESELFGHEKGAFTGATAAKPGRFREADGGTLFLDEIGELPLHLQPKLLRAVQEGTVTPLGGAPARTDARIVAATHRDLAAMVAAGTFREDLYYRLSVVTIPLPPLRERGDDAVLLARAFLVRAAAGTGSRVTAFSHEALEAIRSHAWPGNIRELEHAVRRAVVLSTPPWVARRDLGLDGAGASSAPRETERSVPPLRDARAAFERAYVLDALQRASGNVTRAAREAGVSRQFFNRLLRRFETERP